MTAAEAPKSKSSKQVHATIDGDLYEALVEHRWAERLELVDVFKSALQEYADKRGLLKGKTTAPAVANQAPKTP